MSKDSNARGIDVFVFDLGGVLCEFSTARRMAALSEASGLTVDEVRRHIEASRLIERADTGKLTRNEEYRVGSGALGLACDYATYRTLWCTAFRPDAGVIEIAREQRDRFHTALLTNNGPILLDALAHDLSVVGQEFEHHFVSAMFGATKPDPAVYRGVAAALGVAPDRLCLIDDSAANVDGARQAGWQAIQFRSAEQLRVELHERLG